MFPQWLSSKESACNAGDTGSIPGSGRSPGGWAWQPPPVFLPGESHGQRSLTDHGVAKSWIWLKRLSMHAHCVITACIFFTRASLVVQLVNNLPAMQETPVQFLSWEYPLERGRLPIPVFLGYPGDSDGSRILLQCRRPGFNPWVGEVPWREWLPTPVFLPGEFHGQRGLAD